MAKSAFSEQQFSELVEIVNTIADRSIESANAHAERVVAETIVRERERIARLIEAFEPVTAIQDADVGGARAEPVDLKGTLEALGKAIRGGSP